MDGAARFMEGFLLKTWTRSRSLETGITGLARRFSGLYKI